jgi:hypothetical protein
MSLFGDKMSGFMPKVLFFFLLGHFGELGVMLPSVASRSRRLKAL